MKALVAVEHAMLIAIWNMLNNGALYTDPGADFYTRLNPDRGQEPRPRPAPPDGLRRHPRTRYETPPRRQTSTMESSRQRPALVHRTLV